MILSVPDFGLQFLVVIILYSLTSYLKGCRFSGKVYTIQISLTSYWIRLLGMEKHENHSPPKNIPEINTGFHEILREPSAPSDAVPL